MTLSTLRFAGRRQGRAYSTAEAYNYCVSVVKQHDHDNYLGGLLMPRSSQPHFFAIRAYNVEIASIKDQTNNNALTARVRFQWWRDIIYRAYSNSGPISSEHPVAFALQSSIRQKNLNRRWIEKLIESRQMDISVEQHETLSDLETYAERSCSPILYLLLEILGISDEKADYAASHVGVSSGLVTSLRSLPHYAIKVTSIVFFVCLLSFHFRIEYRSLVILL